MSKNYDRFFREGGDCSIWKSGWGEMGASDGIRDNSAQMTLSLGLGLSLAKYLDYHGNLMSLLFYCQTMHYAANSTADVMWDIGRGSI